MLNDVLALSNIVWIKRCVFGCGILIFGVRPTPFRVPLRMEESRNADCTTCTPINVAVWNEFSSLLSPSYVHELPTSIHTYNSREHTIITLDGTHYHFAYGVRFSFWDFFAIETRCFFHSVVVAVFGLWIIKMCVKCVSVCFGFSMHLLKLKFFSHRHNIPRIRQYIFFQRCHRQKIFFMNISCGKPTGLFTLFTCSLFWRTFSADK